MRPPSSPTPLSLSPPPHPLPSMASWTQLIFFRRPWTRLMVRANFLYATLKKRPLLIFHIAYNTWSDRARLLCRLRWQDCHKTWSSYAEFGRASLSATEVLVSYFTFSWSFHGGPRADARKVENSRESFRAIFPSFRKVMRQSWCWTTIILFVRDYYGF